MKAKLHEHDTTQNGLPPELPACLHEVLSDGLDVKLHLLQHYAELARLLAREILEEEVGSLCGARYSRGTAIRSMAASTIPRVCGEPVPGRDVVHEVDPYSPRVRG